MSPAPRGNKFALGNKGGRPAFYKTPQELEEKITEYFDYCQENEERITLTGLVLYLGFAELRSFFDYEERKDEFSQVIKRAKHVVMALHEERLSGTTPTGSIFWLKNHGWKDTQQIDHTNAGNAFNTLSDAELVDRITKLFASRKEGRAK